MMKCRLKNKAFTMAEVLITLMLIGAIAALTIPDLYLKFEEVQYKTKLINTYSILTEATKRMKADYGGSLVGVLGYDAIGTKTTYGDPAGCPAFILSNPSNSANPEDNIMEMYSRYISWTNKYPAQAGRTGIFKFKTKSGISIDRSYEPILVLIDDTTIAFKTIRVYAGEATYRSDNYRKVSRRYKYPVTEELELDLNGSKGPNVLGRDVHIFDITASMVSSMKSCRLDNLSAAIDSCRTYGDTCGYLWQKGVSAY